VHRYGDTRVISDVVRHRAGPVCAAIPRRDWEFPVSSIKLIGEFTTPGGPILDYFYVFVAGEPPRMFQIPMESLEPVGTSVFFAELEASLPGNVTSTLANSVGHASSVMWPAGLMGQRLFAYLPAPRAGVFGKMIDRSRPRYRRCLAAPLQEAIGFSRSGLYKWGWADWSRDRVATRFRAALSERGASRTVAATQMDNSCHPKRERHDRRRAGRSMT
jgi:hypothetical protein